MGKVALVVGGTGMAGNAVVPHLLNEKGADHDTVICMALSVDETTFASRTEREYIPLVTNINSKDAVAASLAEIGSPAVTDVYWFAEANRPPRLGSALMTRRLLAATDASAPAIRLFLDITPGAIHDQLYGKMAYLAGSGRNELNQLWIENVLDALRETGAPLQSFVFGTGGKHYGMHLGPSLWPDYSSPFHEETTRCPGPLSYFDTEELVQQRADEDGFTWNEIRPSFIIGLPPELTPNTQSFGIALAAYASLLKAEGKPLRFPGTEGGYNAMINLNTSEKIAEVAAWSTNHPDQAFNCPSCPPFSWKQAWAEIADWFGMEPAGPVRKIVGESSEAMVGPGAESIWKGLHSRHALSEHNLDSLLNYTFLDKSLMAGFDSVFATAKLERFGFPADRIYEYKSGSDCLTAFFERLVTERVIPDPSDIAPGAHRG